MKKLVIAGLLITTLILVLISGCKPVGKAIAIPNVTATNIANFPYQFLTSTGSTIGYASTTIFAPAAYSTQVTDLMNFMRLKACQLAANQGYRCIDSQGNYIPTAGAVLGLRGITGAAITNTTPQNSATLYRCYNSANGDHMPATSCPAGYNQEHALGIMYTTPDYIVGTIPLYLCRAGTDHFVSQDPNCEGTTFVSFLGRFFSTEQPGETHPIYRCYNGVNEHMMSLSSNCEGWGTTAVEATWHIINLPPVPVNYDVEIHKATDNYDRINQIITYKIVADNRGDQISESMGPVIINDVLPSQLTFVNSTPAPTIVSGNNLTWVIEKMDNRANADYSTSQSGTFESHGRFDISLNARVNAAPGTDIVNTAKVSVQQLSREATDTRDAEETLRVCDTDSDNGDDPYTAGTLSYQGSTVATDQCSTDGKTLTEYTCSNGIISSKQYSAYAYPITACQNGALNARPIWQCAERSRENENHFVTFDSNRCGGTPFGLIYTSQVVDMNTPIYNCHQEYTREAVLGRTGEHNYYDSFLSLDPNCEGKIVDGLLGYLPQSEMPYVTRTIYRYWKGGAPTFDHILSANPNEPNTESRETIFNFISPCIDTDKISTDLAEVYTKGNISAIGAGGTQYAFTDDCQANNVREYSCDFSRPENYRVETNDCPFGTTCADGHCTTAPGSAGTACTNNTGCQSGLYCIFNICTERTPIYNCYSASRNEYYPSRSSVCRHPITHDQETTSGVLLGYTPEYAFPDTVRWGVCVDTATYSIPIFFPAKDADCAGSGKTFDYVGTLFTQQRAGTTQLYARQGPQTQLTQIFSVSYKFYYTTNISDNGPENYTSGHTPGHILGCGNGIVNPPETCDDGNLANGDGCDSNCQLEMILPGYCGDGTVRAPEQCEPPNTATCDGNCQNIVQPPANLTNYTYIPPTNTIPPTGPPITITTNYIAIGTCTDNPIIADATYGLGAGTCSVLMPGEAIIQLNQIGTITGLIIAGGSPADVSAAIQVLKNLTKWSAEGSRIDVTNNAYLTTVGRLSSATGAWLYNMEYNLPAGIHFLGVPFTLPSKTIANIPAVVSAAGGIFAYDATNNRSVKFDVNWPPNPPAVSDLSTFGNELEAYYVKVNTPRTFMLTDATKPGAAGASVTRNVAAGWVAYSPYKKQKTLSQIFTVSGVAVNSIYCYENNQFVQKNLALNPTIDVGQGCWINIGSGATLQ